MREKDELKQFFARFDKSKAKADPVFRYQLKQALIEKYETPSYYERLQSAMAYFGRTKYVLGSVLLSTFIISILTFSIYTGNNIILTDVNYQPLNENEKKVILSNIYKANASNQLQSKITSNANGYTSFDLAQITTAESNNPLAEPVYNIKNLTQNYTYGTKADECVGLNQVPLVVQSSSNFAIDPQSGDYYIDTKNYGEGSVITSYQYQDKTHTYKYLGGSYGVITATDKSVKVDANLFTNSDLANANLLKLNTNNVEYYQLTLPESNQLCSGGNDGSETNSKILKSITINSSTYKIEETAYYLNTVSPDNLIMRIKANYSEGYATLDNVNSTFTKPSITFKPLEEIAPTLSNYGFKLLVPEEYNLELNTFKVDIKVNNDQTQTYLFDQEFFPREVSGTNLARNTQTNNQLELQISYTIDELNFDVIKPLVSDAADSDSPQINVIYIDNTPVSAVYDGMSLKFVYFDARYIITIDSDIANFPRLRSLNANELIVLDQNATSN